MLIFTVYLSPLRKSNKYIWVFLILVSEKKLLQHVISGFGIVGWGLDLFSFSDTSQAEMWDSDSVWALHTDAKCPRWGERESRLPSDPHPGWRWRQQDMAGKRSWAGSWGDIWTPHLSVYLCLARPLKSVTVTLILLLYAGCSVFSFKHSCPILAYN